MNFRERSQQKTNVHMANAERSMENAKFKTHKRKAIKSENKKESSTAGETELPMWQNAHELCVDQCINVAETLRRVEVPESVLLAECT